MENEIPKNSYFKNKQTKNVYRVLFPVLDATMHRAGTYAVVYETVDSKVQFVMDKAQFLDRFSLTGTEQG